MKSEHFKTTIWGRFNSVTKNIFGIIMAEISKTWYAIHFEYQQDRQISTYNIALRLLRVTTVAVEKQYVSVALVIQQATRMRRVILLSAACLALPHFSTLSKNSMIFGDGELLNMERVLISSTNFVRIISHPKTNQVRHKKRT